MSQPIIHAKAPSTRDQVDLEHLQMALQKGYLSGSSSTVREYEQDLADYFGVEHAVAVSSGTAAIHCALSTIGVSMGDEVMLPVTAPVMTALPIVALGAKPVFVDTQEDSFGVDLDSIERNLSQHTRCVISVPMWGYPTNVSDLSQVASVLQVSLIEDAAQAIGTVTRGQFEGTFGAIGCFSTHELKLISTGEGGFLLTNEDHIAERLYEFSRYGMIFRAAMPHLKGRCGFSFGLNYKLNSLAAALGVSQLKKLDMRLESRKKTAKRLADRLKEVDDVEPLTTADDFNQPNSYAYIVRIKNSYPDLSHEVAMQLREAGIHTDFVEYDYRPLYEYPIFRKYVDGIDVHSEFPHALALISSLVILPTHEQITTGDIDYICQKLQRILRSMK